MNTSFSLKKLYDKQNISVADNQKSPSPPATVISDVASDFMIGIQNTTFCRNKEVHVERTHKTSVFSIFLGHSSPSLPQPRGLRGPYLRYCKLRTYL